MKLMPTDLYLVLADYLTAHESDITNKINDFGDLFYVFKEVIGREPVKKPK